jgi:hypothetical protein
MANRNHPAGAFLKGKDEPLVETRRRRRAADAQALRDAYADVDRRDAGYCWVTGQYSSPHCPDPRYRREHHHLKGRRVRPDWVFRPERIITVTKEVHDYITAGWIAVEGCDARKPLFFHWTELAKRKPFELTPRRRQETA